MPQPQITPEELTALVEDIATALVDEPQNVRAELLTTKYGVVVGIACNASQRGMLIGKDGRVIEAVRLLTSAMRRGRVTVLLEEELFPRGGVRDSDRPG